MIFQSKSTNNSNLGSNIYMDAEAIPGSNPHQNTALKITKNKLKTKRKENNKSIVPQ